MGFKTGVERVHGPLPTGGGEGGKITITYFPAHTQVGNTGFAKKRNTDPVNSEKKGKREGNKKGLQDEGLQDGVCTRRGRGRGGANGSHKGITVPSFDFSSSRS